MTQESGNCPYCHQAIPESTTKPKVKDKEYVFLYGKSVVIMDDRMMNLIIWIGTTFVYWLHLNQALQPSKVNK